MASSLVDGAVDKAATAELRAKRPADQGASTATLMSTALADTSLAVAVDIGGTFTDIALHDAKSGQIWRAKTPSVPADPSQAFLAGVRLALEDAGRAATDARPRAARHDRRHQHDPRGQGRARRPGHHQRASATC